MPLKTERRTQHRKRPLSLVYVELPPSNGGMMRDLSEHGFSLRAMMPVTPSEKVPFSFVLDSSARIDGEAIVLRVEDEGRVAALEFAGLPPHSRDQIRRWLEKFDEPISPAPSPIQSAESKHVSFAELRSQIRAPKASPTAPPAPETATPPPAQNEIAPLDPAPRPPQIIAQPPKSEAQHAPQSQTAENEPVPPLVIASPLLEGAAQPVVEIPPLAPVTAEMALPKLAPPQEQPPAPPPLPRSTIDQPETSSLPPLLNLSAVRPGSLHAEIDEVPAVPVEIPNPVPEPQAKIEMSLPKRAAPAPVKARTTEPVPAPPVAPLRKSPPALEPLSSFEGETDSESPGWMDRFTLSRAVGIMLFLTLLAGSYVYHREVGQSLIWLGHQIAGDDVPESSKVVRPDIPAVSQTMPESTPPAGLVPPPPLTVQQSPETSETKSATLPVMSDKTPSPQIKSSTPGALVPLTQLTRPPVSTSPADNSVEPGQQEYLEALQILRSPSQAQEVPAAVRLLWAAVEKGNTGAEIDLAELFRTGRGVAKNCDQTRILLSAAARKGNAEARKRLEAFQRDGCSN